MVFRVIVLLAAAAGLGASNAAWADNDPEVDTRCSPKPYPTDPNCRPLTLPAGMVEMVVYGGYWPRESGNGYQDVAALWPGVRSGITAKLTAEVFTAMVLTPTTSWSRSFDLSLRYLMLDTEAVDMTANGTAAFRVAKEEQGKLVPAAWIGIPTRVVWTVLGRRAAVYCGEQLLVFDVDGDEILVNVDVELKLMLTRRLGEVMATRLIHLQAYGDGAPSYAGAAPLRIGLFFAHENVDVQVEYDVEWHGVIATLAGRL